MMFSGRLLSGRRKNMFSASPAPSAASEALVVKNSVDAEIMNRVYYEYAEPVKMRKYENISTSQETYEELFLKLQNVDVRDSRVALAVRFAISALVGSMNARGLYESYAYDEVKMALLAKNLEEVLSGKNSMKTLSGATSTMEISKNIKLSRVFSYYVYLYGFPVYGAGFDMNKLKFVQSMPIFSGA